MNTVHVVTGAGPVGSTVALQLADAGHQVRLLTRSGSGPAHPLVDRRRAPPGDRNDRYHRCGHNGSRRARPP